MKKIFLISIICSFLITLYADSEVKTIERYVSISNDAAEEQADGSLNLRSSDLEMTREKEYAQTIGVRFTNLKIPKDATITKAYIQFQVDKVTFIETFLTIYAEDTENSKLFLNTPFNITSRPKVKASVSWKPPAWKGIDERGLAQRTAELKSLLQPIINKKNWQSGNAIAFIINGYGQRIAKSYKDAKKENNFSPMLHIEYTIKNEIKNSEKLSQEVLTPNLKPIKTGLIINEVLAVNSSTNFDPDEKSFSDWIELYNETNQTKNIGGYYLSNDINNMKKFQIPNNSLIEAFGYLLIWADKNEALNKKSKPHKKKLKLHLSNKKWKIPADDLSDQFEYIITSSGKNGTKSIHTNFKLAKKSTLLLLDRDGVLIDRFTYQKQKPDISCAKKGDKIVFMTPTPNQKNGLLYVKPKRTKKPFFSKKSGFYTDSQSIKLSHKKDADIYYTLDGSTPTTASLKYTKPITIYQTIVIRARALEKDKFISPIANHTYLIDENVSLPVVSMAIDERYLYDKEIGIAKNYKKRWIRPGSVEYIKDGKSQFSENIGIKISGNNTRGYPQKSFAIFAKKKYGAKSINYPLFCDKPHIKKIKSFTLRNSGTKWGQSMMREGVEHRIVKDNMDIDYQSYHPVVMFLNGQYWGIYNIREKMNEDYLKSNHGIKNSKVDLIEDDEFVKEGSMLNFNALIEYIKTHDLSDDANFNKATEKIDMTEFMNHIIVESFIGNRSIHHNIKRWKAQTPTGKWRTLLFDLDRGFDKATNKVLGYVADNDPTSLPFTYFLQNEKFIQTFASFYFSHLNSTFQTQRMDEFITQAKDEIQPEIKQHFKRWSKDIDGNSVSIKTWQEHVDKMYLFSKHRDAVVREKLKSSLNLKGNPKLSIKKVKHGTIYLDDIKLIGNFEGRYFDNAKVTLKAVADKGYKFKNWSDKNSSQEITLIINKDINMSVVFVLR